MSKKQFFVAIFVNLVIAIAFFISNLNAVVTDISSDLANIIPICKKLDNPNLYQNDLYLGDINNVKYYTPFYVESLRFIARFTNFDYIQALNVLSLLTHFIYGMLWFYLLFLIRKDFIIALLFSIFMRGIIWPPGYELLGIADLWTIMPRTLFSALLPLPFIIYKLTNQRIGLASLVLGLLVNFHPISGIGAIIIYVSLYFFHHYYQNSIFELKFLKNISIIIILIFVGMLPYLLTYLTNVKSVVVVDQVLFNEAIHARINLSFFDSMLFLTNWNRPFTYFFGFAFIIYYFADQSLKKINFKIIFFTIIIILIFCNSVNYIEQFINKILNLNFRFAFQIIRAQKLVLVLLQVAMFLLIVELVNYFKINNRFKIAATICYIFLLSISSASIFDNVPLIGDDISRLSLPNNLKFYPFKKIDNTAVNQVFDFVNKNTPENAVFYCKEVCFRTATNRSEALDFHAAGMLIEGNAIAYTNAYLTLKQFNQSNYLDKVNILKTKKVNYIIDKQPWKTLQLVYQNKDYYVYKL